MYRRSKEAVVDIMIDNEARANINKSYSYICDDWELCSMTSFYTALKYSLGWQQSWVVRTP